MPPQCRQSRACKSDSDGPLLLAATIPTFAVLVQLQYPFRENEVNGPTISRKIGDHSFQVFHRPNGFVPVFPDRV